MFKVEDLRTGMKVVTNDNEYIILKDCRHNYRYSSTPDMVAVNPKPESCSWQRTDMNKLVKEAIEVFIPEHPYDIFYNLNGWVSIWKKEPVKTEAQLKLEELKKTIEDAQRQIEQLKETK